MKIKRRMLKKEYECSLLHYNTFGIAAKAACMMTYSDEDSLREALDVIAQEFPHKPVLHIGGGSNLLFLSDFDGVVLHSEIKGIEVKTNTEDEVLLRVGAGTVWDDFVAYCVSAGYYGVENLSLIPGEVGASAVQNIGAYGAEAKDVIVSVETVSLKDGSSKVFKNEECGYGYRLSRFKTDWKGQYAVTYVWFRLSRRFIPNIEYGGIRRALNENGIDIEQVTADDVRRTVIAIRKEKLPDPAECGNAGSFFMNPVVNREVYERLSARYEGMPYYQVSSELIKIPAGWLIEKCGWKGRSLGRAAVHDRQALVLVNKGGATGADIMNLCDAIRKDVKSEFDIDIYPEVNFIGQL
jgi:UDP-N-acetylmuramate dehydrogenase